MTITKSNQNDIIEVKDLSIRATCGQDAWAKHREQPLLLTMLVRHPIAQSGVQDELKHSLNYGQLSKTVKRALEGDVGDYANETDLLDYCASQIAQSFRTYGFTLSLKKPKSLLQGGAHQCQLSYDDKGQPASIVTERACDIETYAILGVNLWEREEKQKVLLNLELRREYACDNTPDASLEYQFYALVRSIQKFTEGSSYLTIEALVTAIAYQVAAYRSIVDISIRAAKPSAIAFADSSAVSITRNMALIRNQSKAKLNGVNVAYLGIGSNIGDRYGWLHEAVQSLKRLGVNVLRYSPLYQSAPMYYLEQSPFLNAVIEVNTDLDPVGLLNVTQSVESLLKREKTQEKGPRNIDIDILLHNHNVLDKPQLQIPHPRILERNFVLRPLSTFSRHLIHPLTSSPIIEHFQELQTSEKSSVHLAIPLRKGRIMSFDKPKVMGILNMTPDSFSDGGQRSIDSVVEDVKSMVDAGADIIDIGGHSTRPGAEAVSVDEELSRVLPAVQAIREARLEIPISIDTFRAIVAKKAHEAGCDIINDVSGGLWDQDMLRTVASLDCPICLMHTRGTPATMTKEARYDDLVREVKAELQERVDAALEAGIKRWNIILDPGIGFAKNSEQNLSLLKRFSELTSVPENDQPNYSEYVWLSGPSRKRFLGSVADEPVASERVLSTAGAVYASLNGGAHIIRVHDVKEMKKIVSVQHAISSAS